MRRTALCSMRFALAVGVAWGASLGAAHAEPDDKPALVRDAEAKAKAGAAKAGQKAQPTVGEQVHAQDAAKAKLAARDKAKSKITLSFSTRPSVRARVYYGKKLLGTTPFEIQWPHDSGPVDVVVRAGGYIPVSTRAYTFRDDDIVVELTRPVDASRLLGYKKKIEPPPDEAAAGEETVVDPAGAEGAATPQPAPTPAPTP